jgi:hypothetical protein
MISAFARDLKSGRIPLERQMIADCQVPRLRVIVYRDGPVKYRFCKDGDPYTLPASSIAEARKMALALI